MTVINKQVAVLLAAYNGEQWISEQVQTILVQQNVDVVIFISVDLSMDGTLDIVSDLSAQYSNMHVLPYGEKFGSAARNFFRLIRDVDFSGFDFICFSDQDDIWQVDKLSHAVSLMEKQQVDAYSSDVVAFWPDGREKLVKKSFPQKRFDFFFEAAGPGCTYVLKRGLLLSFKSFLNEHWDTVNKVSLHDWLIYAYCRANGMKWFVDHFPLMRYRQHLDNQFGHNSGIKAYLKRIRMINESWYRQEVEKIYLLVKPFDHSELTLSKSFLIRNFWQLRRRPRDALVLLLMMLFSVY